MSLEIFWRVSDEITGISEGASLLSNSSIGIFEEVRATLGSFSTENSKLREAAGGSIHKLNI